MKSETDVLRRPFLVGVLAVGIVVVLLGGLVALFGSTDDRPEGVAERWLTAVGDLTREGVHDDAVDRVAAHGDVALSEGLIAGVKPNDKSAFTELEVGKARRENDLAFVPAKIASRATGASADKSRVVVLRREGDTWRVFALQAPDPTLKVPGDGGDVASKAPLSLYLIALSIGVGIAAAASALVQLAGREHERALHA